MQPGFARTTPDTASRSIVKSTSQQRACSPSLLEMYSLSTLVVVAATAASLAGAAPVFQEDAIYQALVRRGGPPANFDVSKLSADELRAHMTCGKAGRPAVARRAVLTSQIGSAVSAWNNGDKTCSSELREKYSNCVPLEKHLSVPYPTIRKIEAKCTDFKDDQSLNRMSRDAEAQSAEPELPTTSSAGARATVPAEAPTAAPTGAPATSATEAPATTSAGASIPASTGASIPASTGASIPAPSVKSQDRSGTSQDSHTSEFKGADGTLVSKTTPSGSSPSAPPLTAPRRAADTRSRGIRRRLLI